MNVKLLKTVFIRTIPIMTGYIVLGTGFGILLSEAGFGIGWAFVMSLTIYSGTMEYMAVDLLSSGASVITTAIMAIVMNARYMFYGISMIDRYKGTGWMKPYLIFGLTDENYALLTGTEAPEGSDYSTYSLLVSFFDQVYWIIGSVLGVLIGSRVTFSTDGVEFVMTALFVTVFTEQWRSTKNHTAALTGVVTTLIWLFLLGQDRFLIPSMISITLLLAAGRRFVEG